MKERSVGERIRVAESYGLGKRDRCAELLEMRDRLEDYDPRAFRKAMQDARPYIPEPIDDRETRLMNAVGGNLDRVQDAYRMGDFQIARQEIDDALENLGRIRYPLDSVVSQVMYTGKKARNQPGIIEVGETFTGELAGEPTVGIDYTLQYSGRVYHGREIYLVKNNRLFVASFQGLEENLPLFDRLVETIDFPSGPCTH